MEDVPPADQVQSQKAKGEEMQGSTHNLGHRKHRQAFRKPNKRNRTVCLLRERDVNRELAEAEKMRANKRTKMYASVEELMKGEAPNG